MAGSSSIQLKEVHVRMSGTASNRNFGNLSPEVKLIFVTEGLENWSEGLQQMVNTTYEAFEHAARRLVQDFEGIGSGNTLLYELGIKPQTSISIMTSGDTGTYEHVAEVARGFFNVVPLGDDGEYDPDFDDDGFGDDDDDEGDIDEEDFEDEPDEDAPEDTQEADTSPLSKVGADF